MTKEINDIQDMAIYNAISVEHDVLRKMYEKEKQIKELYEIELENHRKEIKKQTKKVKALCKNRIKNFEENGKLILDFRD